MRAGMLGLALFSPLFYLWLHAVGKHGGNGSGAAAAAVLVGQTIWAVGLGFTSGNIAAFEVETWLDEPSCVYTGVALGHSVAMVLFGGTVPTVATSLYSAAWAPPIAPFLVVSLVCAFSLACHQVRLHGRPSKTLGAPPGEGGRGARSDSHGDPPKARLESYGATAGDLASLEGLLAGKH
jgi:hypothetical protein